PYYFRTVERGLHLAFRFKVKRTPDDGGDHTGVVDGCVGPAFELALEGTGRIPLPRQLVEARAPLGRKMDPKPRWQQPQAPLTRVFSALAFRLAAISDSA